LLFLFVFFVFVLRFIYWNGILPPRSTPTSQGIWSLLLWGGCFVIFYLLFGRRCECTRSGALKGLLGNEAAPAYWQGTLDGTGRGDFTCP
jgi:hypothetical protein